MTTQKSPFLARLQALFDLSERSVKDIATELGYDKPNIVSMFRTGTVKVPLAKVPALAKALHADPAHLLRLALAAYDHELLEVIDETMGPAERDERKLLALHREVTKNVETNLPDTFFTEYKTMLRKHLTRNTQ